MHATCPWHSSEFHCCVFISLLPHLTAPHPDLHLTQRRTQPTPVTHAARSAGSPVRCPRGPPALGRCEPRLQMPPPRARVRLSHGGNHSERSDDSTPRTSGWKRDEAPSFFSCPSRAAQPQSSWPRGGGDARGGKGRGRRVDISSNEKELLPWPLGHVFAFICGQTGVPYPSMPYSRLDPFCCYCCVHCLPCESLFSLCGIAHRRVVIHRLAALPVFSIDSPAPTRGATWFATWRLPSCLRRAARPWWRAPQAGTLPPAHAQTRWAPPLRSPQISLWWASTTMRRHS